MPTITPDTLLTFPVDPSYGFIASPYYETSVVRREGGYERVNQKWQQPLVYLQAVPIEEVSEAQIHQLRDFYHVMRGRSRYFRIRDWSDYRSAESGVAITANDQPLVEIGSTGTYQLVRAYIVSTETQLREIAKPVGSTVRVANTLGQEQSDWTLDEATGILTPDVGFTGTPAFWGGEYDIEGRFDSNLNMDIVNYGTRNARVSILERRRRPNT